MTMTCSTETKTTSHDIGCDSAADLDWCCLKMLLLLALQSLLVCSLHSGQAVANPVASLVETTCANSCSCSDMEDFTQKSARKVEAHFEDSLDDLLESVETMVSSQIDSISTTAVENILRNFTNENSLALTRLNNSTVQQASNLQELLLQVETMREEIFRRLEDLKTQQILLFNSTLMELRTHFEQLMTTSQAGRPSPTEELRHEIGDIKDTVNMLLQLQRQNMERPLPASNGTGIATSSPLEPTLGDMMAIFSAVLLGSYEHPVNSCKDLPEDYSSGDYYVLNNCNKIPVKVYCDMSRTACNSTGGWNRVSMLDMTNSSHECPTGLKSITRDTSPHRLCGSVLGSGACNSVILKTHGIYYSKVCGKIKGYQFGAPYAFYYEAKGIESNYVEGVSLTYGNAGSRKHIWTFAAGPDETNALDFVCPCTRTDLTWAGSIPNFIGQNYFCDTANHNLHYSAAYEKEFYDDPLWDGNGCVSTSTCCCFNTPPWFCTELPESTNYDIELRLCNGQSISTSETPIEVVELYVK
ncbi:uncharacterized protein LOC135335744 isoform X3 [Halichondria panicea]|uniref:uncharacterized protein LOC135335744 isoform X3 n=1 Tax=Halichondria panicea TaxID=6063 RepID=UPI00312B3D90